MKRIGIVGAGRFGTALALALAEKGAEVILVDKREDLVQRLSPYVSKAACADATDIEALREIGLHDCDVAVVAIGTDIQGSILAAMNLKDLKVPVVIAKAASDTHGRVLERIGVDQVVNPHKERAQRLARSLLARYAQDYFEIAEGVSVVEMLAPQEFVGKTLAETNMRKSHGLTVLVIERRDPQTGQRIRIVSPSGDDVIQEGDTLLIFGPDRKLDAIS